MSAITGTPTTGAPSIPPLPLDRMVALARSSLVGEIAAGVAHELNNPLSVILGFAAALRQDDGK